MDLATLTPQYTYLIPGNPTFTRDLVDAIDVALTDGQIKLKSDGSTKAASATVVTICDLVTPDGTSVSTGYAFCSQEFRPELGNTIALGRALKRIKVLV